MKKNFLVLIPFFISACSDSFNAVNSLSKEQKKEACKLYISNLFGKPADTIEIGNIKENKDFSAEIIFNFYHYPPYIMSICNISNNTISWTTQKKGEDYIWYLEDEIELKLQINQNNSKTLAAGHLFTLPL